MKKLLSLNLCVFFILLLCSCQEPQPHAPAVDFSAEITVAVGGVQISGGFSNTRQGVMTISVTSPDSLSGVKYGYKDGKLELSLDGLVCRTTSVYLPAQSFANRIFDCMTLLKNEESYTYNSRKENNAVFKAGEYAVYTDFETGLISKIETEEMTAEFSNQQGYGEE